MDVQEVLNHARDAMTVKRVFGKPYEKDGVTIIPVANVMGGLGAGGGHDAGAASGGDDVAAAEEARSSGYGMGYAVRATPAGVYVVNGGQVEWRPALDMNRIRLQRVIVTIVGLLVLRSVTRTLAKR
ncbi:MAG: spore germination protein GerW family protein [Candidatus Limnocylindrales bacterium]